MQHTFENEFLKVTINSRGAELASVVNKETGAEMMWEADPAVWGRHAPILFPYSGSLRNKQYTLDGQTYAGSQHGFARDFEHEFLGVEGNSMKFVFTSNADTLKKFPREFRFETTFTLDGRCLRHAVKVTNTGDKQLRFGLGYHPGFAFPFDDQHTTEDYELRFDGPQTPIVLENGHSGESAGLVVGTSYVMAENSESIPLDDRLFDNDSLCLSNLHSKYMSIVEKDSGRKVQVRIENCPYVLIWSAPGNPNLKFICIEPWYALQDKCDASGDWNDKECAAELAPGEAWDTFLDITFDR